MATMENARGKSGGFGHWLYDERVRNVLYQLITFCTVGFLAYYLFTNTAHNIEARGMSSGFGFITQTAGFDTDFKLIEYTAGSGTYGRIYIVGILNTLFVSVLAIVFTTIIGFFFGILRLSKNWIVSKLAAGYVEVLRNTPLLMQIIYWYLGVFALLPRPKQSAELIGGSLLNNRGLYMPSPIYGDLFWLTAISIVVAIAAVVFIRRWAHKRQDLTGQIFPVFWVGLAILIALPGVVFLITGSPLSWEYPELKGFNYQGGVRLPPAFLAMLVALSIYHSCYIAEMVRAGIQAVHSGQTEASHSLGIRPGRTLQLVIIPQAMRAIVPPMISTWMNVVKNSSLAVAIGYPDIVSVFMQTSLNQSGYAIEIVGMTMLFYMVVSLSISACMNIYNKRVQLKER